MIWIAFVVLLVAWLVSTIANWRLRRLVTQLRELLDFARATVIDRETFIAERLARTAGRNPAMPPPTLDETMVELERLYDEGNS